MITLTLHVYGYRNKSDDLLDIFPLLLLQNKFLVTWKRSQYMLANAMHAASSCYSNALFKKGCFRLKITLVLFLVKPLQCKKTLLEAEDMSKPVFLVTKGVGLTQKPSTVAMYLGEEEISGAKHCQKVTCRTYPTPLLYRGTGLQLPTLFLPRPKKEK